VADLTITVVDGAPPVGEGTWLKVTGISRRGSEISAYIRMQRREDAWLGSHTVVSDVLISGDPAVHSEDLRGIPLGRIERLYRANWDTIATTGRVSEPHPEQLPQPIGRPVKGEDQVPFANRVANAYRFYAARTPKPALAIAQAEGAPVGTVRRWIREARELGVLEKGTQGKAG
jgi:hypothetical protein